jgi:hypothetical protein
MAGDATPQHKQLAALTRKVVQTFLDARPADCIEAIERMEEAFGASKLTSVYREKCERYLQDPSQGDFECQIALTTK